MPKTREVTAAESVAKLMEEAGEAKVDRSVRIPAPADAVVLTNPKFPHNVGAVVRAASCYECASVWITGTRVPLQPHAGYRLPREERMRGYRDVALERRDDWFDVLPPEVVPVAVELRQNSEPLTQFVHPVRAVYVFGPEDGSVDKAALARCHRFVVIPTRHCTNLSAAVYTVLYDRLLKAQLGQLG
jgi:tRNA(Leu) C34 or U34 (ribose-2'-O)-methylase TrmL